MWKQRGRGELDAVSMRGSLRRFAARQSKDKVVVIEGSGVKGELFLKGEVMAWLNADVNDPVEKGELRTGGITGEEKL